MLPLVVGPTRRTSFSPNLRCNVLSSSYYLASYSILGRKSWGNTRHEECVYKETVKLKTTRVCSVYVLTYSLLFFSSFLFRRRTFFHRKFVCTTMHRSYYTVQCTVSSNLNILTIYTMYFL